jgi:hypothetical protein
VDVVAAESVQCSALCYVAAVVDVAQVVIAGPVSVVDAVVALIVHRHRHQKRTMCIENR